jgi:hypothetical protein
MKRALCHTQWTTAAAHSKTCFVTGALGGWVGSTPDHVQLQNYHVDPSAKNFEFVN